MNGDSVEFDNPAWESERAHVVKAMALHDLPHAVALLHEVVNRECTEQPTSSRTFSQTIIAFVSAMALFRSNLTTGEAMSA